MHKEGNNMNGSSKKGVGVIGIVQIVFVILKLCGLINWSWWAVLIPLWIDLGIIALFVIIYMIIDIRSK